MSSLTFGMVVLASALGAGDQNYAAAYKLAEQSGKPLVLLVGADWCPGCRTMKNSVMPQVEKQGLLGKVSFGYVNTDQDGDIAGKVMQGGSIPQLIMFRKTAKGWSRQQLTGAQSVAAIESFINQATEAPPIRLSSR